MNILHKECPSSKNCLQEFCQKLSLDLPVYNTIDTSNGFLCIVELNYNDKIYKASSVARNKKYASKAAADCLLETLKTNIQKSVINIESRLNINKKYYIMIDLENVNSDIFCSYDIEITLNTKVIGYATKGHPSLNSTNLPDYLKIKTTNCSRLDAADILMCMEAQKILNTNKDEPVFIIVTGDHFGEVLKDILIEKGVKVYCFRTLEQLLL